MMCQSSRFPPPWLSAHSLRPRSLPAPSVPIYGLHPSCSGALRVLPLVHRSGPSTPPPHALRLQVLMASSSTRPSRLFVPRKAEGRVLTLFSNFSIGVATATTISEVDNYLSRPVENILDPLKWWTDNQRNYPNLSSMALDYLSIPRKS